MPSTKRQEKLDVECMSHSNTQTCALYFLNASALACANEIKPVQNSFGGILESRKISPNEEDFSPKDKPQFALTSSTYASFSFLFLVLISTLPYPVPRQAMYAFLAISWR